MSVVYKQIPLNLQLRAEATFDNFVSTGNEALLHTLCASDERYVYLWADEAGGKTHLLQALCHQAHKAGKSAAFIPLLDDDISEPEIFMGLENLELVCIDDLHTIAGRPEWETALFTLFNQIRDNGGRLVISARYAPNQTKIQLADLVSRLNWGVIFQICHLQDEDKIAVLQLRAGQSGLELSKEVAEFMLKHSPRDMANLFALLARLDTASLTEQRRLTIPFVKQHL